MPQPRKPARLWQRKDGVWVILDAGKQYGAGGARGAGGRKLAEEALSRYIAGRIPQRSGPAQPNEITVGEVLALYAREKGPTLAGAETLAYAVKALAPFWAGLTCDAVKGSTCRAYARQSGRATSTDRRHLGVLQAALNHAHAEGVLLYAPKVTLTDAGQARDRWLTRGEAARLLRAAAPHLRRFILISLATGTRATAVLSLRWTPSLDSGWVDLDAGVIHRRGEGERETNKRRGAVAIPRQLRAHLSRWARSGGSHVVMWKRKPVAEIDTAFAAACRRASVEGATVHDLKRTAVTWAFQRGMTMEDAVDWFSTSRQTLERVYRQHSPHHQSRAKAIMEGKIETGRGKAG
jgi:integrase